MSANPKTDCEPWDRERIKYELRRRGHTLASLCREHNKCRTYFTMVLIGPMAYGEKVIADIIGVHPSEIWPARYGSDGRPLQGRFLRKSNGLAKQDARQALAGEKL